MNTKKVMVVLPEETFKNLKELSESKKLTMSAVVATSIEYYKLFWKQAQDGFVIKAEKDEYMRTIIKKIDII